jgi:hypothetical protein
MSNSLKKAKTILIVETEYRGHYLIGYIRFILRSLQTDDWNVVLLTTKEAINHDSFKILTKEKKQFKTIFIKKTNLPKKNILSLLWYQIKFYYSLKKTFKKINIKYNFDHVFLNSLDRFDKILSILGSPFLHVRFSGILLGVNFHMKYFKINFKGKLNIVSIILFKKLLKIKNLNKIIVNDPLFPIFLKNKNFINSDKVKFLHDPKDFPYVIENSIAKKKLQLKKSFFYVLVYGAIKSSKGIEELLLALNSSDISKKIRVLIVGEHSSDVKHLFRLKFVKRLISEKTIYIYNKWQSNYREILFFCAADAIWVGYKNNPYPSGVLYQASILKTPVLVSNFGIIGWLNKRFKIGYAMNMKSTEDVVKKINSLSSKKNVVIMKRSLKKFSNFSKPIIWINELKKILN